MDALSNGRSHLRVIVCTAGDLERGGTAFSGRTAWVYLGKDLERREAAGRLLGGKPLLHLNGRLHAVADRLRQPFLDFIASLGQRQTDQLGWWSSSCSWKDFEVSSLFRLICYEHLVGLLVQEQETEGGLLVVVIEDPWLFCQVRDAYSGRPGIRFHGAPSLWPARARAMARGLAARAIWAARLVENYLRQRWRWKAASLRADTKSLIALYSYPQARCLKENDGWADPSLGELDNFLEEAGYAVCRFSPPEAGGFEEALRRRSRYFRPLILYASLPALMRAATASWTPVWPGAPQIDGLPIDWLLRREWHLDRWRQSYLNFRFFFECLLRMLETEPVALLIYPYENQPWERMLVIAARQRGVPIIGYQHGGGLARYMLPYFHGAGEAGFAPLPDRIITSGSYAHELLATGGTPPERLVMGGSLRYQYLRKNGAAAMSLSPGMPIRILVSLPIERDLGMHLIHALRRAFPDGGGAEGLEFAVKPHPSFPITEKSLNWPVSIVNGLFDEAIRPCAALIYTGTTTGLEALAMGRKVVRYRPELLLDMDRGEFLTRDEVVTCGDHDIREALRSVLRTLEAPDPPRHEWQKLLDCVFTPMRQDVWLEAVGRFCRRGSNGEMDQGSERSDP